MNKLPKARNTNIIVQNLEKEILVYDLAINKAYCLNETAALVWSQCDGQKNVAEISRLTARSSKQTVTDDLVWLTIEELKSLDLMDEAETPFNGFKTINRREAIKRVGLASTIALPVIVGLAAPRAADAASGNLGSCGQSCANSASCTTTCTNCNGFGTCSAGFSPCPTLGSPCIGTGFCTGGPTVYVCSIAGGFCAGPGTCTAIGTCNGIGTCQ